MNPRTTFALAVAALVLTGLAWHDARNYELFFQKDLDQPFSFPDASVVGIEIERPGASISLARDDAAGWRLVRPVEYPASHPTVETIVRLVRDLRVRGEGDESGAPGGPDSVRLTLTVRGREDAAIRFGADHPTLPYANARIGDSVVLIDPLLRDAITAVTVDDLRDTAICDIPLSRAIALEVDRDGTRWAVGRDEGGPWSLVAPARADADAQEVRTAIETLNSWGVHSFVVDDVDDEAALAEYGLSPPRIAIRVQERGTGRIVRIRIGDPTDLPEGGGAGVYLYLESTRSVVRATGAALARFPESVEGLRSRRLVRVPQPDITGITLVGDYRRVEFTRGEDRRWRLTWSGDGRTNPVIPGVFETMLEALRGAEVDRFIAFDRGNVQKYGLDRPALDLQLVRASGEMERVLVGHGVDDEPGAYFVWNERWDEMGIAYFPDLVRWRRAPFSLRAPGLVEVPPEALRRVRLTDSTGRDITLVRPYRTWQRATLAGGPEPGPAVSRTVAAALNALSILTADRWAANAPEPPGPRSFGLSVEILPFEGDDPAPWIRLWASPPGSDGARWVRDGDDGWVARVGSPDPFSALEALLTD